MGLGWEDWISKKKKPVGLGHLGGARIVQILHFPVTKSEWSWTFLINPCMLSTPCTCPAWAYCLKRVISSCDQILIMRIGMSANTIKPWPHAAVTVILSCKPWDISATNSASRQASAKPQWGQPWRHPSKASLDHLYGWLGRARDPSSCRENAKMRAVTGCKWRWAIA